MPCGIRRSRTTAAINNATSPITGDMAKVNTWLTTPNDVAELTKPAINAGPPAITVMNALAM
ncbi:hypothetical protein N4R57_20090 [Rhodobacteraceae bacterium D3-12]|nr:hypothetical protein N4R57_20090 [Rhodobacteraceae bacterium D3-12]